MSSEDMNRVNSAPVLGDDNAINDAKLMALRFSINDTEQMINVRVIFY